MVAFIVTFYTAAVIWHETLYPVVQGKPHQLKLQHCISVLIVYAHTPVLQRRPIRCLSNWGRIRTKLLLLLLLLHMALAPCYWLIIYLLGMIHSLTVKYADLSGVSWHSWSSSEGVHIQNYLISVWPRTGKSSLSKLAHLHPNVWCTTDWMWEKH